MKPHKPTLVKGTRDFDPQVMRNRTYMIDIIQTAFQRYGFAPIETPAMEHMSTLTGKYGDEGEALMFKILNSGDFLHNAPPLTPTTTSQNLTQAIAHKGLRYDLTVPLARYVAQHRHTITFPFKRSQIQPVWRADKPQKGRYREFYQCDADIVGGTSLFYETEMLALVHDVLNTLRLHDFVIALNHRLIFQALAHKLGIPTQEHTLCVTLDKLDKIGWPQVRHILAHQGIPPHTLDQFENIIHPLPTHPQEALQHLATHLGDHPAGQQAIDDLTQVLHYMDQRQLSNAKITITPTLARGMGYYTGTIFEVYLPSQQSLGSIAGGGRYDDLATIFGMPPLPSIGFSFGLERLYEALNTHNLFPHTQPLFAQLIIIPMTTAQEPTALQWLTKARQHNIATDLYPPGARLKKALSYAHHTHTPWVAIIGEDEAPHHCKLKNMHLGQEIICTFDNLVTTLQKPPH